MSKDIDFFHSREIYLLKTIGYCQKTGFYTAETTLKKVVYKTSETTFELTGNKIV